MTLHSFKDRSEFGLYLTSARIPGTGVEVGVYKGEFSNKLLWTWSGQLIGVDCYNNGTEFELLQQAMEVNRYFIQNGRYKIYVCSSPLASNYTLSELAFVYLDAEHSYEAVKADIAAWFPKIRVGGILCGHDCDKLEPGVSKAVNEFMAAHPNLELVTKPCGSWFVEKK